MASRRFTRSDTPIKGARRAVVVSHEIYDLLVSQKFSLRVHSVDDVLRIKFGLHQKLPTVQQYSHEFFKDAADLEEEMNDVHGKIIEFQKGVSGR